MSLKALANAALQQCAPRTLPAHLSDEAPAHSSLESEYVRTLQTAPDHDRYAESLRLARLAIARAALSDEQKRSRIRDIEKEPSIAPFWAQHCRDDQNAEKAKE
jgi:hypothetical protein